jgi:hypothetical protein
MVMSVKSVLTTIADKIRSYTGKTDKLKLDEMPTEIEAVYNAGKSAGGGGGSEEDYQRGYEEGRQAQYDEFWDHYQNNGSQTMQTASLFAGRGWDNVTLKPKYSVVVNSTYMLFAFCAYNGDLADIFENRGLTLAYAMPNDSTQQGYMFYNSLIKAVGLVDISALTNTTQVASFFNTSTLETIRNLIPPKCAMGASCWGAALTNLGIDGEITKNFNLSRCSKLTAESADSVIEHLADLTGKTTQTLTFHNTVGSKLTEAQKQQITAKNWTLAY